MIGFRSFTRKFGCIIYATHSPGFNGDVEWRLVSAELSLVFTFYCMMIRWCGMTVGESWIQLCFHPFIKKKKKKERCFDLLLHQLPKTCIKIDRRGKMDRLSRVNRVVGWSGHESGRVDPYFSNKFFFFWNRCNLSIVYEFLNCN